MLANIKPPRALGGLKALGDPGEVIIYLFLKIYKRMQKMDDCAQILIWGSKVLSLYRFEFRFAFEVIKPWALNLGL